MFSSTPEKKKEREKKEKKKEKVTFIKTTWTPSKPGNRVKSDWSTKPNKDQRSDLDLCRF